MRRLLPLFPLLGPLTLLPLTATGDQPFVSDSVPDAPKSVREGPQWQEQTIRLPPWPADADLIPLKLDNPDERLRYAIDAKSLSTGSDGVVRYTVVARAGGRGVGNVTYEGLRCTPRGRYKVYAYGADGAFTPADIAGDWLPIAERGPEAWRYELWRHYLCVPRLFQARSTTDQLRMLRSGRVPANESGQFIAD